MLPLFSFSLTRLFFKENCLSLKLFLIYFVSKLITTLDPDPNWAKILDPDPNSVYLDPQQWVGGLCVHRDDATLLLGPELDTRNFFVRRFSRVTSRVTLTS